MTGEYWVIRRKQPTGEKNYLTETGKWSRDLKKALGSSVKDAITMVVKARCLRGVQVIDLHAKED